MRIYNFVKNSLSITKSEVMALDKEGKILVNGKKENLSRNIRAGEVVTVDGKIVEEISFSYFIYNKPKGVICTNNKNVQNNILNNIDIEKRVYPVGRLDKDTHGLLILTNDNKLTHYVLESKKIEKEYLCIVKNKIDDEFLNSLTDSIIIHGKPTIPAKVKKKDDYSFYITLMDGRYHEIRKLVIHGGNTLLDLERIRIGNIILDDNLEIGKYKEVPNLKELL